MKKLKLKNAKLETLTKTKLFLLESLKDIYKDGQ